MQQLATEMGNLSMDGDGAQLAQRMLDNPLGRHWLQLFMSDAADAGHVLQLYSWLEDCQHNNRWYVINDDDALTHAHAHESATTVRSIALPYNDVRRLFERHIRSRADDALHDAVVAASVAAKTGEAAPALPDSARGNDFKNGSDFKHLPISTHAVDEIRSVLDAVRDEALDFCSDGVMTPRERAKEEKWCLARGCVPITIFATIVEQLKLYLRVIWVPRFLQDDVAPTCRADIMSAAASLAANGGNKAVLWVHRPDVYETLATNMTFEAAMSDPALDVLLMDTIEADICDRGLSRYVRDKAADDKRALLFWRILEYFCTAHCDADVKQVEVARAAAQLFVMHLQGDCAYICQLMGVQLEQFDEVLNDDGLNTSMRMDKRYVHAKMFVAIQRSAQKFLTDRHDKFLKSSHYLVHFADARKMVAKMRIQQRRLATESAMSWASSCLPFCGSKRAANDEAVVKSPKDKYAKTTKAQLAKLPISELSRREASVSLSHTLSRFAKSDTSVESSITSMSRKIADAALKSIDPNHIADPAAGQRKYYNAGW
jgi:hypothetical protein